MSHLPTLIADLALILISASIITLLFKWLKQPLVLGYIIAGLLAGPYINIFPTVGDIENINIWAEIGVIFLLFALGLEFSFKKLMNVGSTAFITAITEVISMLLIGYLVGQLLGIPFSWGECCLCRPLQSLSKPSMIWNCVTNVLPVSYSVLW